jgi:hypothetical protein
MITTTKKVPYPYIPTMPSIYTYAIALSQKIYLDFQENLETNLRIGLK